MESTRTRNRKIAKFIGASTVTFCYMTFLCLAFVLCLTIWCHAVYLTAINLKGARGINFMDGLKMNRTLAPFHIAYEDGTHSYDFQKISEAITFLYIVELCILITTIPQLHGAADLVKATEKGGTLRQAYWRATRHQNIQYSALLSETSLLLAYSVIRSLGGWTDPYQLYWGVAVMSLVMLIRIIFLIMVETFVKELYKEGTENYDGNLYPRLMHGDNAGNLPMMSLEMV